MTDNEKSFKRGVVRIICDEEDLSKTLSDCSKNNIRVIDVKWDLGWNKYVFLVRLYD